MTRSRRGVAVLVLCLAAAACDSGTEPAFSEDGFSVRALHGQLELRNDAAFRIHYLVVERGAAAVVDLAPVRYWPTLPPGERKTIPHEEMIGYHTDATEALVYWAVELELREPVVIRLR